MSHRFRKFRFRTSGLSFIPGFRLFRAFVYSGLSFIPGFHYNPVSSRARRVSGESLGRSIFSSPSH